MDIRTRLYTTKQAAKILNVSEASVRRWTDSGTLRCYRMGPRKMRRISDKELEEFLIKCR
jgi:transcriptional repressor of dcmA and dcmR